MVVSNCTREIAYPALQLNGTMLECVHTYRQLGIHLNDRMNWDDHVNQTITKANKKLNIIWKLNRELPRYETENVYTTYIRPQLEYCCLVYQSCTKAQQDRLEHVQRRAAVTCTGAFNRTSTTRLLDELGWSTLETRRNYYNLLQIYKMEHQLCPAYLTSLLPPKQGHRRVTDFRPVRCNTSKFQHSFLPAATRQWNALPNELKTAGTISTFKNGLKKKMFREKVKYYSMSKGKTSIQHTRMRLGLSHLRHQLYTYYIIPSPECLNTNCNQTPETPQHYFLACPKYAASRQRLMEGLTPIADRLDLHTHTHTIY